MLVTMATPISSHVKDKNSIFTRWRYDFLVKGKIVVFHQYLCNKNSCFRLQYAVFIFLNRHKNYLELAELRFESVRVKIQNMYVGNSGVISRLWFELARVRVIGSQLYWHGKWFLKNIKRRSRDFLLMFSLKINLVGVGSHELNFFRPVFPVPIWGGGGGW